LQPSGGVQPLKEQITLTYPTNRAMALCSRRWVRHIQNPTRRFDWPDSRWPL